MRYGVKDYELEIIRFSTFPPSIGGNLRSRRVVAVLLQHKFVELFQYSIKIIVYVIVRKTNNSNILPFYKFLSSRVSNACIMKKVAITVYFNNQSDFRAVKVNNVLANSTLSSKFQTMKLFSTKDCPYFYPRTRKPQVCAWG